MYTPTPVPREATSIPNYLSNEVRVISQAISGPQPCIILKALSAEPKTIVEDMTVQADGTNWNPGSGRGLYQRRAGVWVFIG